MKPNQFFLACLGLAAFPLSAKGAALAYYQLDGGAAGTNPGSVLSETGTAPGTAQVINAGPVSGALPSYSASVPGPVITSGIGGPIVNASNTTSLSYTNPATGTGANMNAGGKINVPTASTTVFQPASFTVESFVNTTQSGSFTNLFSYNRTDGGGSSWMLDTSSNGTLRARFDTQTLGTTGGGYNQNITTSAVINNGAWHHIAMSYNGVTNEINIYVDYVLVRTATSTNDLVYDSSAITFGGGGGGQGYQGLMDEVRLSDAVLLPTDFLRAVPEPTTALLSALGLLGLLRRKRA